MKKTAYVVFLSLLSCNGGQENNSIKKRNADILLENLEATHPNYMNNTMVLNKMDNQFKKQIDSAFTKGIHSDIPLTVLSVDKNQHGDGAIVVFYSDNYDPSKSTLLSDRLNFDLIGFIDEKKAANIVEGEKYYVTGKNINKLSQAELNLMVPTVYYGPEVKIEKDVIGNINYYAGDYAIEITELKKTQ